jgi:Tfp pilus assembly protein PilO
MRGRSHCFRPNCFIPDDPDLAQFILDLNDAANQSGVNLLNISPTQPSSSSSGVSGGPRGAGAVPPAVKVSMNITGGYFQVLDFLDRLDTLSRLVVVDTLSVTHSSGSGTSAAPELTVAITARMFTTKQPPVAPTTGVATTTTSTTVPGATTTTAAGATTSTTGTGSTTTSTP